MCTETDKFYNAFLLIPPNQKCIALNVALYITAIITCQYMRSILFRNRQPFCQQLKYGL